MVEEGHWEHLPFKSFKFQEILLCFMGQNPGCCDSLHKGVSAFGGLVLSSAFEKRSGPTYRHRRPLGLERNGCLSGHPRPWDRVSPWRREPCHPPSQHAKSMDTSDLQ